VVLKNSIFWDIKLYSPLTVNRCIGGTCCLHLEGWRWSQARNQHKQAASTAWLTLLLYNSTLSQAMCFGCYLLHTGFLPLKTWRWWHVPPLYCRLDCVTSLRTELFNIRWNRWQYFCQKRPTNNSQYVTSMLSSQRDRNTVFLNDALSLSVIKRKIKIGVNITHKWQGFENCDKN
jgi:hypothetical protein